MFVHFSCCSSSFTLHCSRFSLSIQRLLNFCKIKYCIQCFQPSFKTIHASQNAYNRFTDHSYSVYNTISHICFCMCVFFVFSQNEKSFNFNSPFSFVKWTCSLLKWNIYYAVCAYACRGKIRISGKI